MAEAKTDPSITIARADDRTARASFIRLPRSIYGPEDAWITPLEIERSEHLDPDKNPYFRHAETALFLAHKNGRPAGRISAQICALYLERYQNATGHFGFLDAIDDPGVFEALIKAAADWLAARGMTHMQGPFSFSINDETGLLVDGFNTPPSLLMGHAKPYYAGHLEKLGFRKAKDLWAYEYRTSAGLPRSALNMIARARADDGLIVRAFDKSKLAEDLTIVLDIYNDAWSDNWGYVPMTDAEITHLAKTLKMLVRGDYIQIAEINGEPAAMAISLPNVNAAISDLDGRLLPFGWLKLLWRLKARPPQSVRLLLMGVRRKYHGTPLGAALALSVIDAVRAYHKSRGTTRAELSWILEDNMPMRRMIERIGGRHYKTYRVYQRAISQRAG